MQSQSFAPPRWVLSPHPSIVICNLVNGGKQGEKKKAKSEGVESRPLRITLLLQALPSEWLNLLTIRC